ncbi:MAG TPA: RNA-binding protein [Archaeoglobaceae archaeon]|nr:RNA-binding protein [Archaeoglobaceae archaeon]
MKLVLPGDKIGFVEEFVAGKGAFEESGEIFASVVGRVVVENRVVNVKPFKNLPEIKKGDVVLGRVVDIRNSLALIELSRIKGVDRELMHTGIAALHVSNVQNGYLKELESAIKYMDIIKARVIDSENLKLSTKEPEMGVIKSICSFCRHELLRRGDELVCPECGNAERRKLSTDYGLGGW